MDAIKNQISDLQSPSIKKDHRTPESFPKSSSRLSPNLPVDSGCEPKSSKSKKIIPESKGIRSIPCDEEPLMSRRHKREQEQKNFREFLQAQRQAKVICAMIVAITIEFCLGLASHEISTQRSLSNHCEITTRRAFYLTRQS